MKRSYSEYRAILISLVNRIREKQLKTGLGASIEELKDEFGGPSKSQRNLDNYLAALRDKGIDGQTYNIVYDRTQRVYYIESGLYKPSQFDEKRKVILAKELLKTYKYALPRSVLKLLDMDTKVESEEMAPLFRSVSPRFVKSLEFYQMLNRILQLADLNRIIAFEYKVEPEQDHTNDPQYSHLIQIGWTETVMVMPLQVIEYMGRLYLLGYRVSILKIQEAHPSPLKPRNIDLFVLDNILDRNVRPIDEHHDFEPNQQEIIHFQKNLPRRKIFEELLLNRMLNACIGVMLPSSDIYSQSKSGGIKLNDPPKILRYFAGWAKRYLISSPLHPSQQLVEIKVVKPENLPRDLHHFYQIKADSRGHEIGVEVGLFSFEVYSTMDFVFRIASFREFSWEYEKGIDGMSDNKPNYLFKNQPQILDESEYKALLKKISTKVHEQANYAFYKQCEEEWWDYYNKIYTQYSKFEKPHKLVVIEAAPKSELSFGTNHYLFNNKNLGLTMKKVKSPYSRNSPTNDILRKIYKKFLSHNISLLNLTNKKVLIELAKENVLIVNMLPTYGIQLDHSDHKKIRTILSEVVDYNKRLSGFDYKTKRLKIAIPNSLYPINIWQKVLGEKFETIEDLNKNSMIEINEESSFSTAVKY